MPSHSPTPQPAGKVADAWEDWCGETPWSRYLRKFGELGGTVKWLSGMPRSPGIPLCFILYDSEGNPLPDQHSCLKDIREAVKRLERNND